MRSVILYLLVIVFGFGLLAICKHGWVSRTEAMTAMAEAATGEPFEEPCTQHAAGRSLTDEQFIDLEAEKFSLAMAKQQRYAMILDSLAHLLYCLQDSAGSEQAYVMVRSGGQIIFASPGKSDEIISIRELAEKVSRY